jgi:hypothetical protein
LKLQLCDPAHTESLGARRTVDAATPLVARPAPMAQNSKSDGGAGYTTTDGN